MSSGMRFKMQGAKTRKISAFYTIPEKKIPIIHLMYLSFYFIVAILRSNISYSFEKYKKSCVYDLIVVTHT